VTVLGMPHDWTEHLNLASAVVIAIASGASEVAEWCEKHAGLGGWVGAVGAIVAIFATWGIARAEYSRAKRLETARRNEEIALFERIISDFNPIVLRYLELVDANDRDAIDYAGKWVSDPKRRRIDDLDRMPVTQWPSVASYDSFKRYFTAATSLLATSAIQAPEDFRARRQTFEGTFDELQLVLEAARR
jgi:hypothetical protein